MLDYFFFFFQEQNFFSKEQLWFSFFTYCKAKKILERSIQNFLKFFIFENILHKKCLKGGISIHAYFGPPRYLCTLMLWWYLLRSPHFFASSLKKLKLNINWANSQIGTKCDVRDRPRVMFEAVADAMFA